MVVKDSDILVEINKGIDRAERKYGWFSCSVKIVDDLACSIDGSEIRIGRKIPIDLIVCCVLHECYIGIKGIDHSEVYREKDENKNLQPYIDLKVKIWEQLIKDFPDLEPKIRKIMELFGHKK